MMDRLELSVGITLIELEIYFSAALLKMVGIGGVCLVESKQ